MYNIVENIMIKHELTFFLMLSVGQETWTGQSYLFYNRDLSLSFLSYPQPNISKEYFKCQDVIRNSLILL